MLLGKPFAVFINKSPVSVMVSGTLERVFEPAALVHYSAEELLPCIKAMGSQAPPLLPRYRVRVLDGNHLTGTEHRIFELRRFRAAALPGQALVFYDPQFDVMTDVIPCEDAYAQERSLLDQALNCISARDCILADRNFCTTGFLFGICRLKAFFVIRQHASTLSWELEGKRRGTGKDDRGREIYEQAIRLSDPRTGETFTARRITIALDKPNKDGERELHILANLPQKAADAVRIADLYADRWPPTKSHFLTAPCSTPQSSPPPFACRSSRAAGSPG